ncbi:hypothetical protein [Synechococcus sp. NOUM97013]|nr:hypothetical protein [Synechococcus sp. NOUM97013]QNI72354.1 hypothetical protein SynNOUM97013_00262 [Synechococcus sp. NOUM97013]
MIKHDRVTHTVRWALQDLWKQVAHVEPTAANPTAATTPAVTRGAMR